VCAVFGILYEPVILMVVNEGQENMGKDTKDIIYDWFILWLR
jgi:hypothetical protein